MTLFVQLLGGRRHAVVPFIRSSLPCECRIFILGRKYKAMLHFQKEVTQIGHTAKQPAAKLCLPVIAIPGFEPWSPWLTLGYLGFGSRVSLANSWVLLADGGCDHYR